MTVATLYPTDDAHVDDNNPNTNYGTNALMDWGDSEQEIFIQFDITSIPTDATISNAVLYFYIDSITAETAVKLRDVVSTFDESTVTWNNKPSQGVQFSSASIRSASGWMNLLFTNGFSAWLGTSDHLYVKLCNEYNTESMQVRSSDYASFSPYLVITYTAPPHRYVKASGGSDLNGGETWADAWATIDKAAKTVADGTTVHIGFGAYAQTNAQDISPINAGSIGIKYLPETAVIGGGTGEVVITLIT